LLITFLVSFCMSSFICSCLFQTVDVSFLLRFFGSLHDDDDDDDDDAPFLTVYVVYTKQPLFLNQVYSRLDNIVP